MKTVMITTIGVVFEKKRSSKMFESSEKAKAPNNPNPTLRAVPYNNYLEIIQTIKPKIMEF